MSLARKIGALALSVAAIAMFFLMSPRSPKQPDLPDPTSYSSAITSAQSSFTTSNGDAQYIYGQIYASGVATKDMLTILAEQADDAAQQRTALERADIRLAASAPGPDQRVPAEIVLLLLTVALFVATTPRQNHDAARSVRSLPSGAIVPDQI